MTRKEFGEVLMFLGACANKEIPEATINAYFVMLGDLPLAAFQAAAQEAVANSDYPTLPAIGVLRKLALGFGEEYVICPHEAWGLVRQALVTYGSWRELEALASLPPLVAQAARALGWSTICVSEAPTIISAQFRATYEALATKEQRRRLLPPALRKQLDEMIEKSTTADAVIEHKP
jgi:hypothetical protein